MVMSDVETEAHGKVELGGIDRYHLFAEFSKDVICADEEIYGLWMKIERGSH